MAKVSRCEISVLILLSISLLLQTMAIVAPGWVIDSNDKVSVQYGIFYYVICEDEICKTVNTIKALTDSIKEDPSTQSKIKQERDLMLNYIRTVVGVLLSWISTAISVALLGCIMKKETALTHVRIVVAVITSVTGIIMGELTYVFFVELITTLRLYSSSDFLYKNDYAHFPYCLLAFAIACILEFVAVALTIKCHIDEMKLLGKYGRMEIENGLHSNNMPNGWNNIKEEDA